MADAVAFELRGLGLDVIEDATGAETGSDAGNLLARVPGPPGAPTILLGAHLDTVPLAGPVEVLREESGVLRNRHEAVLGADNKAAIAVLLAVARRLREEPPPVGVELLFTTGEERALAGVKALAPDALVADWGFVFDHASPVGELILSSPSYYRVEGHLIGQAAHAGIRPEAGRNAIEAAAAAIGHMRLGRLDEQTTANVGRIVGGSAPNVVAEHCRVELEARSLDHDQATALAAEMIDRLTDAASDWECDVETVVEEQFRGYRMARSSPPVQLAAAALEAMGREPRYVSTGGGSDANVLQARMPCLNVANGTERNHQPDESVTVEALETVLDLALGIVAGSAAEGGPRE